MVLCPCCGYDTLEKEASYPYEICYLCRWQNAGQDDSQADEYWGPANYYTLTEARENFKKHLIIFRPDNPMFDQIEVELEAKKKIINSLNKLNEPISLKEKQNVLEDINRFKLDLIKNAKCPCCGYHTLQERAGYSICYLCGWEDEPLGRAYPPNRVLGGANGDISLEEARENFNKYYVKHRPSDKIFQSEKVIELKKEIIKSFEELKKADSFDKRQRLRKSIQSLREKL